MSAVFRAIGELGRHPVVRRLAAEIGLVALAVISAEGARRLRDWLSRHQPPPDEGNTHPERGSE